MSDAAAAVPVVAPPVSAEVKAPVVTKAPEAEPTFELEVDGKKVTLTHTQARTQLQKQNAADKRFKEAADKRAEIDDFMRLFDEDPEAALKKMGKDPEKAFAAHLEKKAKQALMTPEQVERAREQTELATLKADKEKAESERKASVAKENDDRNSMAMERQLIAAADKYSLDASPEVLEGLCDVAADLMDYGTVPTVDQIAQEYIRRETEHIETRDRKVFSKLEGPKLLAYLGKDALARVRAAIAAADAESLKAVPAPALKPKPSVGKPITRDSKGQYVRESDFDRKFGL